MVPLTLDRFLELIRLAALAACPDAESASLVINVGADLPRVVLPVRIDPINPPTPAGPVCAS